MKKLICILSTVMLSGASCLTNADTGPNSYESEYFMPASQCYQPATNGRPPSNPEASAKWGGVFNMYDQGQVECVFPIKHDREIDSIVISMYQYKVELGACSLKIMYDGSSRFYGNFGLAERHRTQDYFRIDNVGSFSREAGGHGLVGALVRCSVKKPTENNGHTSFKGIRIDYN